MRTRSTMKKKRRTIAIRVARIVGIPKGLMRRCRRVASELLSPSRFPKLLKLRAWWHRTHPTYLQTDMDQVKEYPPLGECIYCGARGSKVRLDREHILAY